MRGRRGAWRFAPVLAALLVLAGCSGGGGDDDAGGAEGDATPSASPEPTSLTDVEVGELPVVRAAYCDSVDPEAVEAALGGPAADEGHYTNGEEADLTEDVRDIAHEHGCSWTGESGVVARSWLFVPPVAARDARGLVADARGTRGCDPVADAPSYGEPSVALVCRSGRGQGRAVEVSYRGLFGDAWLSCSLEAPRGAAPPRAELLARADTWCLESASAAAT